MQEFGVVGRAVGVLKRKGSIEINGKTILLADVSVEKKGNSFAFVMDTRLCKAAFELAKDVDFLVCESTYLASETADAVKNGHLTALQAAEIASKANVDQLVLTHFSQRYNSLENFVAEAQSLHLKTFAVSDGDCLEILRK